MNKLPDELTERHYVLKCKLKFYRKTVRETIKGVEKSYDRTMCLLIPQESDERTKFLTAWLPDTAGEYYELASFISYPVDSPCRLSIHRSDEKSDRHYLFVMSKGVEDILLRLKEDSIINVETLAASEDSETDFAKDTERDIEAMV